MYSDNYEDDDELDESSSKGSSLRNFYGNNKKLIWILIAIVIFVLIAKLLTKGGSSDSPVVLKDPKLVIVNASTNQEVSNNSTINVSKDSALQLRATVENYPAAVVTWESVNTDIADVSATGAISGKNLGTTKIRAYYIHTDADRTTYQFEATVNVGEGNPDVSVETVAFLDGDLMMGVGTNKKIDLTKTPNNAYITDKEYAVSNTSVIRVENDTVYAQSLGTSTIELRVNGKYMDTLVVHVVENKAIAEYMVNITKVVFSVNTLKIKVNEIKKLDYSYEPDNYSNKATNYLKWSSSNQDVATVTNDGTVSALKKGSTVIAATTLEGIETSILIEVEPDITEVTDIVLPSQSITMQAGTNQTITPTVLPNDASNKALSFISNDTSVVIVYPNEGNTAATLQAMNAGTATVSVKAGNIIKTITVTVTGTSSGGSSSGSSGSSSSGSSSSDAKGYSISSRDANGGKFVVNSVSKTKNNAGVGPITITFKITNSNTSYLKACYYKQGSSACDLGKTNQLSNNTLTISNDGTWVIRVAEYKSNGSKRRGPDVWYVALSGSGTGGSSGGSSGGSAGGTQGKSISISGCPTSKIKVGDKVTLTANTSGTVEKWTHQSSYTNAVTSNNKKTLTVTGKAPGTSTITVYELGSGDKAVCNVTVVANTTNPFSVSWGSISSKTVTLSGTSRTYKVGQATIQNNTNSTSWSLYYCVTSGTSCYVATNATGEVRASIAGGGACSTGYVGQSYKVSNNYRNNFCASSGSRICLKAVSTAGDVGDLGCKLF